MRHLLLAAICLLGCRPPGELQDEMDVAICSWKSRCYRQDEESCLADARTSTVAVDSSCTWDRGNARKCVRILEELPCPSQDPDFGFPSACQQTCDCW